VTGLVTNDLAVRYLRAEDRITEETNWKTFAFLMEGFIFLLMGISLEDVVTDAGDKGFSLDQAVLYGLAAAVLLILVRVIFVVPMVAMIKRDDQRAADSKPRVEDWKERLENEELPERLMRRGTERIEK